LILLIQTWQDVVRYTYDLFWDFQMVAFVEQEQLSLKNEESTVLTFFGLLISLDAEKIDEPKISFFAMMTVLVKNKFFQCE